ncbi:aldehyde dehydrogenase family protein [Actinomadura sp.]|jgi:succinate-semialdehyde dehydrogenase/glutarate-semialdehyde dehydrogenase|uniref:aldehyde dehydrogenase family protein n=1 Tax=Actinomadura sp. TaxID=1989 RepID=UPI0037C7CD6C
MRQARLFIGGAWQDGGHTTDLTDKFDGRKLADVHEADRAQVDEALDAVARAQRETTLPHYDRYLVLSRAAGLIADRADRFVETVVDDTGFTLSDARREVERAVQTMTISAEEAKRIHGEVVPLHGAPGVTGRTAFTVRHPLGVVCAITPFNSPLNTVVHKVGPALAAGNAVILKPSSLTPLSAGLLVETLLEAGLPEGLISLVYGGGSTVGQWLLESPVPAFYAFTGSTGVGEHIIRTVGLRKTQLELGSLSSTIICDDASLERAVAACTGAAFRKAGQVCTSVQRLYVQCGVLEEFVAALRDEVGSRGYGDPRGEGTLTGPVISASEADRVHGWITSAVEAGAQLVTGGERAGQVIAPTVLSEVDPKSDVMCREVFGPVVSVVPFDDLPAAIDQINDTPYGLAAGIFTADLGNALTAAENLRMGSVHINETSSSRVDLMPYGGVKDSGMGIEGPRYAIEEMTEQRLITIGRP